MKKKEKKIEAFILNKESLFLQSGIKNIPVTEALSEEPKPKSTKKKSIPQILAKLQKQGVNATLCKRSKLVLGS